LVVVTGNCVVVSDILIAYRLGPLGFIVHVHGVMRQKY
jgi:hypothetical protein